MSQKNEGTPQLRSGPGSNTSSSSSSSTSVQFGTTSMGSSSGSLDVGLLSDGELDRLASGLSSVGVAQGSITEEDNSEHPKGTHSVKLTGQPNSNNDKESTLPKKNKAKRKKKQQRDKPERWQPIYLNPLRSNVKVHPKIEATRKQWDSIYSNPRKHHISVASHFQARQAFWEVIYNMFVYLVFPILWYREGMKAARPRLFWGMSRSYFSLLGGFVWTVSFSAPFLYRMTLTPEQQRMMAFPVWSTFFAFIVNRLIIGLKYGYLPRSLLDDFQKDEPSSQYFESTLLIPGWGSANPVTIAREIYTTEARLGFRFKNLRLTFRNTSEFDLSKTRNCSCSIYATTGDWLIPFLYIFTNTGVDTTQNRVIFVGTLIAVFTPFVSRTMMDEFNWNSPALVILAIVAPIAAMMNILTLCQWCVFMKVDFTSRYRRAKLMTHLLDPKRSAFNITSEMRVRYRSQVFGPLGRTDKRRLKRLDLQTIDIFNTQTIYAWCQLRRGLFDIGLGFLKRGQLYLAVIVTFVIVLELLVIYALLSPTMKIGAVDLAFVLILSILILVPSWLTMKCANFFNKETEKQKRQLTERMVEMQVSEIRSRRDRAKVISKMEDENSGNQREGGDGLIWENEMRRAREMTEVTLQMIEHSSYFIQFFGIDVDNSLVQLIGITVLILAYIAISTIEDPIRLWYD